MDLGVSDHLIYGGNSGEWASLELGVWATCINTGGKA